MVNDKKWLVKGAEISVQRWKCHMDDDEYSKGRLHGAEETLKVANQLDEPKMTLDKAWEVLATDYGVDAGVLRNMLNQKVYIDTAKLPSIPQYMDDFIEENKKDYPNWDERSAGEFLVRCSSDLLKYGTGSMVYNFNITDKVSSWTSEFPHLFVKAVMNGYKVKQDTKQ